MNDLEKYLYKIFVTISKFEHPNLASNISIQLFGKSSSGFKSFKFPLVNPKNTSKVFLSGKTNLFEIEGAYIGRLKKIILTNQDPQSTGVYIKNVRIEIPVLKKSWNFYCNQWLKKELKLTEDNAEEEIKSEIDQWLGNSRYTIKIQTSQCSKLNFDPVINAKIIGKLNETKIIKLNSTPSDNNKPKFESGNTDIFRLEELDIDPIEKIAFFCQNDENGKTIDWFYDSITIDVPSKLTRYLFDRNSRMNVTKSKKETVIEVYPINVKKVSTHKNYCINLYLSKLEQWEDFIQSIRIVLYGDYSISPEIKPNELRTTCSCKNINDQLIHFHHKQADIGPIYKVKLFFSIEKNKIKIFRNLKWYLNTIEIDYHKDKFIFEHKKWINFKKYDLKKKLEFKLHEKSFSKEQKRTICTLSHRLLEESIQNDSYDDSFDEIDDKKKQSSRSSSPTRLSKRELLLATPRSAKYDKKDLKQKLRFEQDLEELANSDSSLSIMSSKNLKSSPKKNSKLNNKSIYESKRSIDDDYRYKTSQSFKDSLKKDRKNNEWSSDDDDNDIKSKKSSSWNKFSKKIEKKSEWSSDEDSFKSLNQKDKKTIYNEKQNLNEPLKGEKLNGKLSSSRQRTLEGKYGFEKKKEWKPSILDEEYDKFSDSPKFSSSLMNRFKEKNERESSFVKDSLREFDRKFNKFSDYDSDLRHASRF